MKFKKRTSLGIACISLIALNRVAFAACYDSEAGEYCLTYKKYQCPTGCYCEKATGDQGALDRKGNGKRDISSGEVEKWCSSRDATKCTWQNTSGECGTSNAAKVFLCPSEFPNSEAGAKSAKDCFTQVGNSKLFNKTINCKAGEYLPKFSSTCSLCDINRRESGYYCPGGDLHTSLSKDQGYKLCPAGTRPNGTMQSCDKIKDITCEPGKYLPGGKNVTSCQKCRSGRFYVCEGGTFTPGLYDQGIRKCSGVSANEDHTACDYESPHEVENDLSAKTQETENNSSSTAISVPGGKYLPANTTLPAACKGTTNYCPGGTFSVASYDQGLEKCPVGATANKDKTACEIRLNKIQMQYGPLGTTTPYPKQCWLLSADPVKYQECVLSTKYSK
jgi:hypothetical protein